MSTPPVRIKPPSPEEMAAVGVVKLADLLATEAAENAPKPLAVSNDPIPEIGGRRDGPDPTRYGDWEKNGRCIDF